MTGLAWTALALGFLSSAVIFADIFLRGYRQNMAVMDWVWPITGLYLGPVTVWAYVRFGRPTSPKSLRRHETDEAPDRPRWTATAIGVGHCGAGCTLGDIIAEFVIFALGLKVAHDALYAEYIGDYVLAIVLGLAFQYFAITPMRGLGLRQGLLAAAKADVLSLSAFEVGLFGWMALQSFVLSPAPHVRPTQPVYWMSMQAGMIIGFATAYPVNSWLIRRGVKEAM